MLDLKSLKSFDWRSLQKYASPKAADDLNVFLEKLPQNTSQTMLILAGVVWAAAAACGLYVTVQLQTLTELRNELAQAEVLKPIVPTVRDVPVDTASIKNFVDNTSPIYSGLEIRGNGPTIVITAKTTASFGQFREAIGHVQNGGSGWRVSVDRLCVGRECDRDALAVALKINKVSVDKPG